MKKLVVLLVVCALGYAIHVRFVELAYALGFAELKQEAVLINADKLKVKCHAYALGWFDEIKLQNKFQACINEHQANGYQLLEPALTPEPSV